VAGVEALRTGPVGARRWKSGGDAECQCVYVTAGIEREPCAPEGFGLITENKGFVLVPVSDWI
jgi:hypothetical protein